MVRMTKRVMTKAGVSDANGGVRLRRSCRLRRTTVRYGEHSESHAEVIEVAVDALDDEHETDVVRSEDPEIAAAERESVKAVASVRCFQGQVAGAREEQETVAVGSEEDETDGAGIDSEQTDIAVGGEEQANATEEMSEDDAVSAGHDAEETDVAVGHESQETAAGEREEDGAVGAGHDAEEADVAVGGEEQETVAGEREFEDEAVVGGHGSGEPVAGGREEEDGEAAGDTSFEAAEREEGEKLAALRRRLDAMGLPETGRLSRWKIIMMEVARELKLSTAKVTRTERNRLAQARWESLSWSEKQVYEEKAKELNARVVRPPRTRKPPSGGRPKGHLRSGCSPKRVQALKSHLKTCVDKWEAVRQKGFHGLISMKATSLREKEFLVTVLQRYDPETSRMKIGEDEWVDVTPADVTRVLGVPNGPNPLPDMDAVPKAEYERYKEKYLGLKFRDLLLGIETTAVYEKGFGEMVILYLMCVYLTPTTMGRVSEKVLHLAWCWGASRTYNWAECVLEELKASLRSWKQGERCKGQEENGKRRRRKKREPQDPSFRGCVHFLMLFYFDRKRMGVKLDDHAYPIGQWTNSAIRERIQLEKAAFREVRKESSSMNTNQMKKKVNTAEPSRKKRMKEGGEAAIMVVQEIARVVADATAIAKAANLGGRSGSSGRTKNVGWQGRKSGLTGGLESQGMDRDERVEVIVRGSDEEDDEEEYDEVEEEEETEYSTEEE